MSSSPAAATGFVVVNPSACFQPLNKLSILNIYSPVAVLSEEALRCKARQEAELCADHPVQRLRLKCLAAGGLIGPKMAIGKLLSLQKATVGTHEFGETLAVVPGLKVSEQEVRAVIQELGSEDTVETTKLIEALTPPLSSPRLALVTRVFVQMDSQGQGSIPLSAMAQLFDHRRHPKFESGKKMREEILAEFLANFQSANDNGRVSEAEFLAFYGAQSAAVDSDIHFDWLVRSTWKI